MTQLQNGIMKVSPRAVTRVIYREIKLVLAACLNRHTKGDAGVAFNLNGFALQVKPSLILFFYSRPACVALMTLVVYSIHYYNVHLLRIGVNMRDGGRGRSFSVQQSAVRPHNEVVHMYAYLWI